MESWIAGESAVRYYALLGSFGLIAVGEALAPRRLPAPAVRGRWGINIAMTLMLSVIVALVFPVLSVGMAIIAQRGGFGVFNVVEVPFLLACALSFVALDFTRYAAHFALHRFAPLWRLHRVHHSDIDYDCTTALRFHPLEAIVTVGVQVGVVAALGAPPIAVLVSEVVTAFAAMFAHANLRMPEPVDRWLRWLLVTPDMHRVHHSAEAGESNTNFSSVLPWWDHLFGTYRAQPALGHDAMQIGLAEVRDARARSFGWLLAAPFTPRAALPT